MRTKKSNTKSEPKAASQKKAATPKTVEEQPKVPVEEKPKETPKETPEVKASKSEPKPQPKAAEAPEILRLYPMYKKAYVTKEGFVHPQNAMKSIVKGLTLYDNPYYNNNLK